MIIEFHVNYPYGAVDKTLGLKRFNVLKIVF